MTGIAASFLSIVSFIAAVGCVLYSIRDMAFLDAFTDEDFVVVQGPSYGALVLAAVFVICFAVFGVIALVRFGIS